MCASWRIAACERRGEVVVTLMVRDEISLAQEGVEVVVARSQLTDVADKLYFLDQAFRAEARDVVEALCE
ncbi:hypothetical protein [Saccharopolyspora tripterygii]